jgi:hypothetical protein
LETENVLLNELFFYIISKMGDLQSHRNYAPNSMEDVDRITTSDSQAIATYKYSVTLPKISYTSKNCVARIGASVVAAPYYKTTDLLNKLDVRFTKAFNDFNKLDDLSFNQYVLHKLKPVTPSFLRPHGSSAAPTTQRRGREGPRRMEMRIMLRLRLRVTRHPMPFLTLNNTNEKKAVNCTQWSSGGGVGGGA